jgi:hypothetical protein
MSVTSFGSLGLKDVSATKTASFTVDGTAWMYPCDATAGAVVATLPAAASAKGRVVCVKKIDAGGNAVTVDGAGAETVDAQATLSTTTQYASFLLWSDGTQWWKLN